MDKRGPLVLCVLDGFGERDVADANAVRLANAPALSKIRATCPMTLLEASGRAVGLPVGQMGNSEVGHLNLGAGRVAEMDLSRIDVAVAEHALGKNPVIADILARAARAHVPILGSEREPRKARVHLMGLVSDGGVHSSLNHLLSLIDELGRQHQPIVVHAFLDGRDTPPKSAVPFLQRVEHALQPGFGEPLGVIGTVSGRFYAMDRDQRWERVEKAFRAIVRGHDGPTAPTAFDAVVEAYDKGVTDEFVEPVRIGSYDGVWGQVSAEFGSKNPEWVWRGAEAGICFNFRPDRMRELCAMLLRKNVPPEVEAATAVMHHRTTAFVPELLCSLTEYDPKLEMKVAFRKEQVADSFGEVISRAGLRQFRCAETEKYAHVTYFFNGGRETPFEGETRAMAASPRDVATYDLKPEMAAAEVADRVVEAVSSGEFDFVLVNFANPDMVGHTGKLDAAVRAVEVVDGAIARIRAATEARGGTMVITADHGNCETMVDATGGPHTAHTTNPVPLYVIGGGVEKLRSGGKLADVAPTLLALLGLPQPAAMTGVSLVATP